MRSEAEILSYGDWEDEDEIPSRLTVIPKIINGCATILTNRQQNGLIEQLYRILRRQRTLTSPLYIIEDVLVANTLSKDRFEFILTNLDCCDNDNLDETYKFAKLRPLFNALNKTFKILPLIMKLAQLMNRGCHILENMDANNL